MAEGTFECLHCGVPRPHTHSEQEIRTLDRRHERLREALRRSTPTRFNAGSLTGVERLEMMMSLWPHNYDQSVNGNRWAVFVQHVDELGATSGHPGAPKFEDEWWDDWSTDPAVRRRFAEDCLLAASGTERKNDDPLGEASIRRKNLEATIGEGDSL